MKLIALILFLASVSLASCRSYDAGPNGPPPSLIAVDWTLSALVAKGEMVAFGAGQQPPTLRFESSRGLLQASGFAGVNRYSGPCDFDDDQRLTFEPLITTRMAGPQEHMALESAFLATLQGTRSYAIEGKELTLTADHGHLVFHRD